MPETRFVRRRKGIADQASRVSTQEQARLLNDPAVPIDHVEASAESDQGQKGKNGAGAESTQQTPQEFLEEKKRLSDVCRPV